MVFKVCWGCVKLAINANRMSTVFKDEGKLSLDYVPPHLPHREKELKILATTFKPLISSPGKILPRVIIRGQLGTGKTALSKRFGLDFEKYALEKKVNVKYVHVNCRAEGSFYNALKNIILQNFKKDFPRRGYSAQELLEFLVDILNKNNIFMILTLDELESLIRKEGSEPLFNLTRFYEDKPPNMLRRIALICIFREPECEEVFKMIDRSTLSTLGFHVIRLEKYTSNQLKDILEWRVREAFKENTVLPDTIELIADLSGKFGDARFAIELLWLAGKYADNEGSKKVKPEHVRNAQAYAHPSIKIEDLKLLSLHEKLLLLSVCRLLKENATAYISMGEVEREYNVVCEEFKEKPRAHVQLWKYVKSLSLTGIISTKSSSKGQRGKTTLIGLPVSAEKLEKEILKIIGC